MDRANCFFMLNLKSFLSNSIQHLTPILISIKVLLDNPTENHIPCHSYTMVNWKVSEKFLLFLLLLFQRSILCFYYFDFKIAFIRSLVKSRPFCSVHNTIINIWNIDFSTRKKKQQKFRMCLSNCLSYQYSDRLISSNNSVISIDNFIFSCRLVLFCNLFIKSIFEHSDCSSEWTYIVCWTWVS